MLDARHLLAGVVPPAGSVLRSSGTAIGTHAHLLTSAFASAAAYSTWTAAGDPASVLAFVEAHLPAGSTLVSTGFGGSNPSFQSVTRSWPPINGVLDVRWLQIEVTSRAGRGTLLSAESQSQWVVTRPLSEQIPSGVREVDVTSGWPGKAPFLSRRVTNQAKVRSIITLFDSLGTVQPGAINCPAETLTPIVQVAFHADGSSAPVAHASASSAANFSWPASVPGWACFPISFNVNGHNQSPLVGNVITPIERLLNVKLGRASAASAMQQASVSAPSNVVVPRLAGLNIDTAYARAHRDGLRVTLPAITLSYGLNPVPFVTSSSPAPGRVVRKGSIIKLRLGCPGCGAGSPAVPIRPPSYRVPRFAGQPVSAAYAWVRHKTLYFTATLAALTAGDAPRLLGNYRIVRQAPAAGRKLSLGRGHRCCGGTEGSFLLTPLIVWGSPTGAL